MQPAQPTPLVELVKSLAGLHQTQHQALMDMKLEQEDRFRVLVQVQDQDRQVLRSLLGREGTPVVAPSVAHVPLMKMGPQTSLRRQRRRAAGRAPNGLCACPAADRGSADGSPTATCSEPPDLRRSQAGHPASSRSYPRTTLATLPVSGAGGQRPTVCDGSTAPGRLPQVAHGRATRRRGSSRSGGAGAVHRLATPWDARPVSGAGVIHYHLLHRPRSVPMALGPAPLITHGMQI